jgi:hypothetical protein
VASMTEAAISQGLTPLVTSADWSGGAVAAEAMVFGGSLARWNGCLLNRGKKGGNGCIRGLRSAVSGAKKAAGPLDGACRAWLVVVFRRSSAGSVSRGLGGVAAHRAHRLGDVVVRARLKSSRGRGVAERGDLNGI